MASIYRKVHLRMYADEKFCELSSPPPCGKYLWLYLLTGPHTSAIPGAISTGEMALSEALEWPLKGFRAAFQELLAKGLVEVDWSRRLIFVPNAIKHNPPESPNVVKSWASHWDLLPECELKAKIYKHLKAFLEGQGDGFGKAFGKAFGKPSAKTKANQEQEQEQEQDKKEAPLPKEDEDKASWLWRSWLFYLRRPKTSHDQVDQFEELVRLGYDHQKLEVEIKSQSRDRTEPIWEFIKRMKATKAKTEVAESSEDRFRETAERLARKLQVPTHA